MSCWDSDPRAAFAFWTHVGTMASGSITVTAFSTAFANCVCISTGDTAFARSSKSSFESAGAAVTTASAVASIVGTASRIGPHVFAAAFIATAAAL